MGDKWMDDRERAWLERDTRRGPAFSGGEDRTWDRSPPGRYAARRGGMGRDPVFGERESGASYGSSGGPRRPAPRFTSQDYTDGGRYYGDDSRERIYREEYGQGGREYGEVPRGYDAGDYGRQAYDRGGYGEAGYGRYPGEPSRRMASGGTGGYDYERGYGDGGRRDARPERTERFEDAGRNAGEFLHRAGERVASWFGGGGEARAYHDYDRDRGHRGRGPQGYKRSDERISDEVHERLTDDAWLDASAISVTVVAGEVTLSGSVEDRDAKHRAERIVEDVSGVIHVQNNLRQGNGAAFSGGSDDKVANGAGGSGAGQSTAGRKG
jgi:osmotically-inducible protein OsmY